MIQTSQSELVERREQTIRYTLNLTTRSTRSEREREKLQIRTIGLDFGLVRTRLIEFTWFRGFGFKNFSLRYNGRTIIKLAIAGDRGSN
jgi:hypothetical protein